MSLIKSAVVTPLPGCRGWEGRNACYSAPWLQRVGRPQRLLNCGFCESKGQLLFFVKKIMHNFKIGFNFAKYFFKSNLYLGCI